MLLLHQNLLFTKLWVPKSSYSCINTYVSQTTVYASDEHIHNTLHIIIYHILEETKEANESLLCLWSAVDVLSYTNAFEYDIFWLLTNNVQMIIYIDDDTCL